VSTIRVLEKIIQVVVAYSTFIYLTEKQKSAKTKAQRIIM